MSRYLLGAYHTRQSLCVKKDGSVSQCVETRLAELVICVGTSTSKVAFMGRYLLGLVVSSELLILLTM